MTKRQTTGDKVEDARCGGGMAVNMEADLVGGVEGGWRRMRMMV